MIDPFYDENGNPIASEPEEDEEVTEVTEIEEEAKAQA